MRIGIFLSLPYFLSLPCFPLPSLSELRLACVLCRSDLLKLKETEKCYSSADKRFWSILRMTKILSWEMGETIGKRKLPLGRTGPSHNLTLPNDPGMTSRSSPEQFLEFRILWKLKNWRLKSRKSVFSLRKKLIRNNESVAKILSFQEIFTSFSFYISLKTLLRTNRQKHLFFPDFQIELRNSLLCYFLKRRQINR